MRSPLFQPLEELLTAGRWRESNEETRRLLAGGSASSDVVLAIDTHWAKASNGQFGLTTQATIWSQLRGSPSLQGPALWDSFKIFGERVGWRQNSYWACWADVDHWPQVPIVPLIPVELDVRSVPPGLLPFHDVLSSGDWAREFTPSDCWGEVMWSRWAELFALLIE